MVFDFLQPVSAAMESFVSDLSNKTLGKKVDLAHPNRFSGLRRRFVSYNHGK